MKKILFLCTGNSCRSQMAEGFARALAPDGIEIFSASVAPMGVNPRAARVMKEAGIDISGQWSKDVSEIPAKEIDTLITLCGHAAQSCPTLPGVKTKIHWPIDDPARFSGGEERLLASFRAVRDDIRGRIDKLFSGNRQDAKGAERT